MFSLRYFATGRLAPKQHHSLFYPSFTTMSSTIVQQKPTYATEERTLSRHGSLYLFLISGLSQQSLTELSSPLIRRLFTMPQEHMHMCVRIDVFKKNINISGHLLAANCKELPRGRRERGPLSIINPRLKK